MIDKIIIPYIFSKEESTCIENNFISHNDWEKGVFDVIKTNIVAHLRPQQGNTCCYCKYELGYDIKQVDIEHILPKSKYEKFTFNGKNLALSCPACNTIKSTKEVLTKSVVRYPRNSKKVKIIHAHYDNYSEHIDIIDDCVFFAKTSKGSETITFCNLFRLSKVEDRARAHEKITLFSLCDRLNNINHIDPQTKQDIMNSILNKIR